MLDTVHCRVYIIYISQGSKLNLLRTVDADSITRFKISVNNYLQNSENSIIRRLQNTL
jgi:hypothetical protein